MFRKCSSSMLILTSLLFLLSLPSASAEDAIVDWGFSKPIQVQDNSQYRSVFLDEEVYAKARGDLADIRIVDAEGSFIPYYIESSYTENLENEIVYSTKMISTIRINNDTLIDFQINPLQEHMDIQGNLLRVTLPSQAFLKFIEVSGSYDGNLWEALGKFNLYNTEQLKKNTIELKNLYKFNYYRLRIIDNVEKLAFSQLELVHNEQEFRWKGYTKNTTPEYKLVQEKRQTSITIHNSQRLKMKKLILDVDGNFRRVYDLFDKNDNQIPFGGVKELYNLNLKDIQIRETSIMLPSPIALEQLVVKINNEDNAPLQIKGLSYEYYIDKLVFEDHGSKSYRLVYGKPNAVKPKYEIENFKSHIEKENPLLASLGAALELPGSAQVEKNSSWFQTKMVFNVVIGLVSLLLVIFLVQKLNRAKK